VYSAHLFLFAKDLHVYADKLRCGGRLGAPVGGRPKPDTAVRFSAPNGQNPDKSDVRLGSCVGVGLMSRPDLADDG
jgi:hypothetical protein